LAGLRALQVERQTALDGLLREAAARRRRLQAIAGEMDSWRTRRDAAGRQIEVFRSRQDATETENRRLSVLPGEITGKRQALLNEIETVEQRRRTAADRLAAAETRLADADRTVKAAEAALLEARENRVRAEGTVEQAEQANDDVAERIAERLDVPPAQLADVAGIKADDALPELEAEERRLERLRREREVMGPVNLRADQEAAELTEQMQSLDDQRRDLTEAIGKLRRGIAELDREGRERLLASFADVDRHFRELFMRLFGGGRAHLTLTDSDDPLEAGLEIMASPPGKRLQVLSLLSGGEQALTALALIFAVFLTNPAPICVLDEVDAPLDDANVDRFCGLLTEMAEGGTRFLVITHHRMTMARMDRLFGVTMAERGVSQLVSVDLQRAEELRQTA
jgi:chromosome segregation protein